MIAACAGVHTSGSTSLRSSATTMVADISSRSRARELAVGHRREPDVGVEADLMAGVAGEHRAAARLRHVADQEPAPAELRRLVGTAARGIAPASGWPQLRLRDSRITCQVLPLIGSALAPARQPLE